MGPLNANIVWRLLPLYLCAGCSDPDEDKPDRTDTGGTPEVFVQVVVGDYHGCALTDRHRVQCWHPGDPSVDYGQADPPDEEFSILAAGFLQTCGLTMSGDLRCWGIEDGGMYDFGQTVNVSGPFERVSSGILETCVIDSAHVVSCWGTDPNPGAPGPRPDIPATQVSVNGFGCLLTEDEAIVCWGEDELGALDAPSGPFAAISAGETHACALDTAGVATCWGDTVVGPVSIESPVDVWFTQLAAGSQATCGLTQERAILCWGGDESTNELDISGHEPEGVFTDVALGRDLACGVRDDGGVLCWGGPFGIRSDFPPIDDPLFASE
jgi:hypothetical protein